MEFSDYFRILYVTDNAASQLKKILKVRAVWIWHFNGVEDVHKILHKLAPVNIA